MQGIDSSVPFLGSCNFFLLRFVILLWEKWSDLTTQGAKAFVNRALLDQHMVPAASIHQAGQPSALIVWLIEVSVLVHWRSIDI